MMAQFGGMEWLWDACAARSGHMRMRQAAGVCAGRALHMHALAMPCMCGCADLGMGTSSETHRLFHQRAAIRKYSRILGIEVG